MSEFVAHRSLPYACVVAVIAVTIAFWPRPGLTSPPMDSNTQTSVGEDTPGAVRSELEPIPGAPQSTYEGCTTGDWTAAPRASTSQLCVIVLGQHR